jgi:eukaryotic-like serine/threonine-protein kinase
VLRSSVDPIVLARLAASSTRSRRNPVLIACGVAAGAAIIIAAAVLLLTRGPSPGPASHGTGTGNNAAAARGSSAPRVTAGVTGVTIPPAFAGTWTGTATMAAIGEPGVARTNSITSTLVAGTRTAHEVDQSCINTLTQSAQTATVLTFSEPQTAACVAGTVTFTRHGTDRAYRWTNDIEQNTAVLHRT